MEREVSVKFYIESLIWSNDRVRTYFSEAGVPESDVITFDGSWIEQAKFPVGSQEIYMGKQLCPYVDSSLREWEYLFLLDMDVFLCRTGKLPEERFPLVAKLLELGVPDRIGASRFAHEVWYEEGLPINWLRSCGFDEGCWRERASEVLGQSVSEMKFRSASGMATLYPKEFLQTYPHFSEFVRLTAPVFQSDEPVLSVWDALHGHKVLYGIFDKIGLFVAEDEVQVYEYHFKQHPPVGFYISHVISDWEQMWRSHIGGEDL